MNKVWYNVFDINKACKTKGVQQCTYDIFQQMKYQYFEMVASKFRRPSILQLYENVISDVYSNNNVIINDTNNKNLITYIDTVKENIDNEIELLIHDGKKWNNHIPIQYREGFNKIFHISYYNLFVLDILKEELLLLEEKDTTNNSYLQLNAIDPNLLIENVIYDLKGLSIEKFGVMPEINIRNNMQNDKTFPSLIGIQPYIHFSFVEIIKNNIQAVIDQYGELEIDNLDVAPIVIDIVVNKNNDDNNNIDIYFHDLGIGLIDNNNNEKDSNPFNALSTSREVVNEEPTYTYSRDFGVQFSGKGIGLLKTKMYIEMHNGSVELYSPTSLEKEKDDYIYDEDDHHHQHGKGSTTKISF